MSVINYYLHVDYRESDLYLLLEKVLEQKYKNINIEMSKENLHIGDLIILDKDKNILFIFERKTLHDLLSSVKDGRYENQSKRLNEVNINNHDIIYLIEGNLSLPGISSKEKDLILSCLVSMNHIKGFSVTRTLNKLESSEYICRLLYKLNKNNSNLLKQNTIIELADSDKNKTEIENNNHISCLKKFKKNNEINKDNIKICFLSQIPGVSERIAVTLMNHYNNISFNDLINIIKKEPEELNNIKLETNGKFRKINKNIIENIKYYLN